MKRRRLAVLFAALSTLVCVSFVIAFPWRPEFICLDCTHGTCPKGGSVYLMTRHRQDELNCLANGGHAVTMLSNHLKTCSDGNPNHFVYFGCAAADDALIHRPVHPVVRDIVEFIGKLLPAR